MRLLRTALVTGALALAPGVGFAQGGGSDAPSFDEADANGDGVVTVEEAKQAGVPAEKAKSQDINDDGELSKMDWKFVRSGGAGGGNTGGSGSPGPSDPGGPSGP